MVPILHRLQWKDFYSTICNDLRYYSSFSDSRLPKKDAISTKIVKMRRIRAEIRIHRSFKHQIVRFFHAHGKVIQLLSENILQIGDI